MKKILERTEKYLEEKLLPFWTQRIVEPNFGGFQTNYDGNGRRTDVTEKTFLCQGRSIFTLSFLIRQGWDWTGSREMIRQGIDFVRTHFADREHGGWYWIVEEDGKPKDTNKILYGHSFLLYAMSEHALMSGDAVSRRDAEDAFDLIVSRAFDLRYGGFYEHFNRQYDRLGGGSAGGQLKSLDVHMHLMEAFTTLCELTGKPAHRHALEQIIDLIFGRMIDPATGLGISMFLPDWRPVSNIQLDTVWGADRFDERGKPPDVTSFGHNIELAWLYLHSQDVLGIPRQNSLDRVLPIFEHTLQYGVDWQRGGVYVEGRRNGEVTDTDKEFWQQAEALVGFLDAYLLTQNTAYLDAFRNIYEFIMTHMVHPQLGEWYCLCDRDGKVKRDWLGSNWKICYHTLRSMTLVCRKLRQIVGQ